MQSPFAWGGKNFLVSIMSSVPTIVGESPT